jgi:uncharacterized protein YgiM (DUF1202 family)
LRTLLFLRFALSMAAMIAISGIASAQALVVRRNVNLRSDPSTSIKPIMLLTPSAQLMLLDADKQNGFYRVRTSDGLEGWV